MKITIQVESGSDFQEEVNTSMIKAILNTLEMQINNAHKKNSFTYTVEDGNNTIQ